MKLGARSVEIPLIRSNPFRDCREMAWKISDNTES